MADDEYVALQAHVIAQAWQDPQYRERLLKDPVTVLREAGIEVPAGLHIRMHQNTADTIHLAIPARPAVELRTTPDAVESLVDTVIKAGVWGIWCRKPPPDEHERPR